jgi:cell division protein FtsB
MKDNANLQKNSIISYISELENKEDINKIEIKLANDLIKIKKRVDTLRKEIKKDKKNSSF